MFPSFRQRLMILLGIASAGWLCLQVVPIARAADGCDGLVILSAAAPVRALAAVLAAAAAATIVGGFVGAWGNPLAGVFTLTASLALAASRGGPIDAWLATSGSREGYFRLAAEAVVWGVLIALFCEASLGLSGRLVRFLPASRGEGEDEPLAVQIDRHSHSAGQPPGGWPVGPRLANALGQLTGLQPRTMQSAIAPTVIVLVGSLLTIMFLRSTDVGQVTWGLALAYGLAALTAHQLAPLASILGMLVSPLAAAILWYLAIAAWAQSPERLLEAHYQGNLWAPGLALPAHYASAAVAGVAAGVGCSQVIWLGRIQAHGESAPGQDHPGTAAPGSARA